MKCSRKPALSIIIPAYNEEKYLPKLLDSIRAQDFKDLEVIVVAKPSKDKTVEVAKKYNCIISKRGDMPSASRNIGSRFAKADILLFLDADTMLTKGFLSTILTEFKKYDLVCGSVFCKPISSNLVDKVAFLLHDLFCFVMQRIRSICPGYCIIIKRNTFEKIKGFDTTLRISEDWDLAYRASKVGRFGFLARPKICISMRRLEKEGRIPFLFKAILETALIFLAGHRYIQKRIEYEFGNY
jgi:glycosyltransferase involved in cell wall biosynthesis